MRRRVNDRIRSLHGNVISADFRPRPAPDLTVTLASEVLYCDGRVILTRATASFAGTEAAVHLLGDLATGHVTTL